MKILSADEMLAADRATFSKINVPARAVMESAGRAVCQFLLNRFSARLGMGCIVICGGGNNGGDGYVIARTLENFGINTTVWALKPIESLKGEARESAEAYLTSNGTVVDFLKNPVKESNIQSIFKDTGVIVDALYGTGFHGELFGLDADIVNAINSSSNLSDVPVLAVDIPSGVSGNTGKVSATAVRATATVCLQCLKIGNVLYPGSSCCGEVVVADIGLANKLPEISSIARELITQDFASAWLRNQLSENQQIHKRKRGVVLVVGGSAGHFGAPKMSAQAALQCGAGLVTLLLPETAAKACEVELRELMCASAPDEGNGNFSSKKSANVIDHIRGKDALVIGPGMGTSEGSKLILRELLAFAKDNDIATVIDADGLNILAFDKKIRSLIPRRTVLTPHEGEMSRLLECEMAIVKDDRISAALKCRELFNCSVVLKGARTVVVDTEGGIGINPAATEALATGGSGDVLSGLLGALVARCDDFDGAIKVGVFLHGSVGERLYKERGGATGIIAGDIIGAVASQINFLRSALPAAPAFFKFAFNA